MKKAEKAKPVQSATPSPEQQTVNAQQDIELALQHQSAGRLPEAKSIYQHILQSDPSHPDALHLLGVIAHQMGENDIAVDLITKALAVNPENAMAHNNLGFTLQVMGKPDEAVASYHKALAIQPDFALAHNNLGLALQDLKKLDEAIASHHQALAIQPDFAEAHSNLGNAFRELGRLDEAVTCYNKALAIQPDFAMAHNNLGNALRELGQLDEAVVSLRTALTIEPDHVMAHDNLGNVLMDMGRLEEAVESIHQALAINPEYDKAHGNLGLAFQHLGRLDEAVISYHKALAIKPKNFMVLNNLGFVHEHQGKLDEAVSFYHKALAIKPDSAEAHNNLGNVFKELGRLDEAVANFNKALAIKPGFSVAHSNLLLAEQYRPGQNKEALYHLHCEWDNRHGRTFSEAWPAHLNTPEPERRLRIGFVSPDLGRHPVGYFVVRLLENLPKNKIETVCYSDILADDLTERIKAAASIWHDTRWVSDEDLTKTILTDEVDILIDLTGHSALNRLPVFARKPAPLQVAWAGYVGTTGLSAIDYLLSDIYSTGEDEEKYYSETILRMPDGWLCYDPPAYAPAVGPLPCKGNGRVTFGSFSNPAKINEEVVFVWSRILAAVANSRLIIKYRGIDSIANSDRLTAMFEAEGFDPSRLTLEGQSPHPNLLARYNDVDIALDPFPYSGGLTTYEALWMGVPVITVPEETFASRHTLSHLSTIGLPELAANDRDDYVKLAVELANDPDRLAGIRVVLRGKMASSPICDGEKFADGFATIMRNIWRKWCLSQYN